MRVLRILAITAVVLVALAVAAGWWLTAREAVPESSDYALDVGRLRRLATAAPVDLPREVRSRLVATASLPRAAVFAGESFEPHTMSHQVFQLVYADGEIVIDAAFDPEFGRSMGDGRFDPAAFAEVQSALRAARQILITHEHGDHIQGLVHVDPNVLLGNLRLTQAQLANGDALDDVEIPADLRRRLEPVHYDEAMAIAPGVVLVAAAGHTPGSQMIFVRLFDGRELLFLGDVAWHMDMIRELHYRPRLTTDLFLGEDRGAVLAQFRALHDLMQQEPGIQLVASHDVEQRRKLLAKGVLVEGLR